MNDDAADIAALVKRRTVYSMNQISDMAKKPTKVMLFWLINHLERPKSYDELIACGVFSRAPQSITKITDDRLVFENGIDPKDLFGKGFRAPQSFQYMNQKEWLLVRNKTRGMSWE